jgi:hypothetical protein
MPAAYLGRLGRDARNRSAIIRGGLPPGPTGTPEGMRLTGAELLF